MTDIHTNLNQLHRWSITLFLLLTPVLAQAETWVITDQGHPVSAPSGTRIILVDEQQRLEEKLSHELPADPRQAEAAIQRYLASPAGKRLQSDLAQAQQGVTDAWSLGVEKLPAVVVDRRYVVYGEPDVVKAVGLINHARSLSR
ncbi:MULTISPECIES: TIGR03757 family integrating conjugative element protein [Pseudomonas]|jgi:integrating conjugative element protein (TIGR03757 family)|uniref:TIGR03757 family integrating conjugative element protein n=1 Tax=Pseudomonas gessardii TaxID=78544 RepID=A0A7Y1MSA6_9PSED|nr:MULTISPECIES: TIGR03757 family integrating conjugative element protein [Pseudomonas]NNA97460.1 TIGR03757 family integrating conjugative element protein [Pseudomonas gessardii]QIH10359.1 TIGR03757 family integrating conjugative element protein [Pseudomonas sp. BIOMIG1BAC]